ncbi:MAG TPA: CDGSH iron-sulfur domain-containing protein [Phenylobacterium sp.]|uniref:CDGSH iron-sulfur domain-containing protein n=1 Tax=Phenylobacterium sp. TaxID=1871053 RepID=UPI002BBDD6E4|nr:CDGSH iron-sulfur domain-containing protein [Phenylobacterium sp.]HXA40847.1 CDGSH iron-sulfur domain-containing protein [Phenylobacterium sp.]
MFFTPNGPIVVGGDLSELKLTDSTGQPIDVSGEKMIYLCRCGGSTTKPFCDGTHDEIGFKAAEAAVRDQG